MLDAGANLRIDLLDVSDGESQFEAAMDDLRLSVLQIPAPKRPSDWISENIVLSKQESSRPGPMRLTGYQRPLADDMADPEVDEVAVLKGVQVGYSRTIAAIACYGLAHEATKILMAQPTRADAQGYYKDTLEPRFREVDAMKRITRDVSRGEAQDTWAEHRYSNGAVLLMRGAAADDALRRVSTRWNMGDEVDADEWQGKNSDSQGEKLDLLRDRGTDFWDSKVVIGSTPLRRDTSLIWKSYAKSDQRQLHVRCPHCHHQQVLRWGSPKLSYGFRWELDTNGYVADCWYQCAGDDACRIDEHFKGAMVEAGEMIATAVPDRPGHRGYHWPSWYSEAPKAAWPLIAQRWIDAQGDAGKLQVFVNNWMAEPWDDLAGGGIDAAAVHDLAVPYPAAVPDDVVLLTAGVDTQTNKEGSELEQVASREVSIVGWSRHEMPRIIGHWVVEGEPGDHDADVRLDDILQTSFRKRDGSEHFVQATTIDLGGHFGDATKRYANTRVKRNVWAIKGKNQALGTRSPSVWPKKVSRDRKGGTSWHMIDTQLAKDAVGRKLKVVGSGGPMFPTSLSASYFEGLAAEKFVTDKRGRRFWTRKSKAQTGEEWDCLVYAYAALCGLRASFRKWRDLNLAAESLGVPKDPPHDLETGELAPDYDGPDRSAQSRGTVEEQRIETVVGLAEALTTAMSPPPASEPAAPPPKPRAPARRPRMMRVSRWG